jgi:hypothetical protein
MTAPMTLADRIEAIVFAFDAGDSRRDDVRALAAEVRALSVIPTCGDCGWQASALSRTGAVIRVCIKSKAREIDLSAAPPSWCELRGKR